MQDDADNSLPGGSPIKLNMKAEASAKLNVNVDVPEESTGRLVDLITRRVEYWTASRALKPGLLRLQQEQVALEVLEIAEKRISLEAKRQPLPNKFIAPFLEQASLEEPDEPGLKAIWAELLVSSSRHYKSEHLRFISLLSEMTPLHCRLLELCALKSADLSDILYSYQLGSIVSVSAHDVRGAANVLANLKDEQASPGMPDDITAIPLDFIFRGGVLIHRMVYHAASDEQPENLIDTYADLYGFDGVDLGVEVLVSMGLLRRFSEVSTGEGGDVSLEIMTLTKLGVAFVEDCIPEVADRIHAEEDAEDDWLF